MLAYSFSVIRNAVSNRYIDLRYGGKLATTRKTEAENTPGIHGIQHTDWKFLHNTFKRVPIKPSDVLVDVGCGDGRVISYWLSLGLKNKLIGIEIDAATAKDTAQRFARFRNVQIISGDAAELAPKTGGTLFYLFNPFLGEPLSRFAAAVEGIGARIVFYSYNDLTPFKDWKIEKFLDPGEDPAFRFAVLSRPATGMGN